MCLVLTLLITVGHSHFFSWSHTSHYRRQDHEYPGAEVEPTSTPECAWYVHTGFALMKIGLKVKSTVHVGGIDKHIRDTWTTVARYQCLFFFTSQPPSAIHGWQRRWAGKKTTEANITGDSVRCGRDDKRVQFLLFHWVPQSCSFRGISSSGYLRRTWRP